jgi:hypothetical protein
MGEVNFRCYIKSRMEFSILKIITFEFIFTKLFVKTFWNNVLKTKIYQLLGSNNRLKLLLL